MPNSSLGFPSNLSLANHLPCGVGRPFSEDSFGFVIEPPSITYTREMMNRSYTVALQNRHPDPCSRGFRGQVALIHNGMNDDSTAMVGPNLGAVLEKLLLPERPDLQKVDQYLRERFPEYRSRTNLSSDEAKMICEGLLSSDLFVEDWLSSQDNDLYDFRKPLFVVSEEVDCLDSFIETDSYDKKVRKRILSQPTTLDQIRAIASDRKNIITAINLMKEYGSLLREWIHDSYNLRLAVVFELIDAKRRLSDETAFLSSFPEDDLRLARYICSPYQTPAFASHECLASEGYQHAGFRGKMRLREGQITPVTNDEHSFDDECSEVIDKIESEKRRTLQPFEASLESARRGLLDSSFLYKALFASYANWELAQKTSKSPHWLFSGTIS